MKCAVITSVLVVTIIGLLITSDASADDWQSWTGPEGTNATKEHHMPASFDTKTGENIKWVAELGNVAYGCTTVADGRVYIGTSFEMMKDDERIKAKHGGVIVCLDEKTGDTLWRMIVPQRTDGRGTLGHQKWGICSSPLVEGDRVYVVTGGDDVLCLDVNGLADGNDGPFQDEAQFIAGQGVPPVQLRNTDADIIWRYDMPVELDVEPHDVASCSPMIHDNVLYTNTSNGVGMDHTAGAANKEATAFIALDKRDGRLLATEQEGISQRMYHTEWCSPSKGKVNGEWLVFLGGGEGITYAFKAVDADKVKEPGKLECVWTFDGNPEDYKVREDGTPIPYYSGDVRGYNGLKSKGLDTTGHNSGDGTFIGPNQIIATPIFDDGYLYVAMGQDPAHGLGRSFLYCIDASQKGDITKTGLVWVYDGIQRTMCTPAIAKGLLYIPDLGGTLHCLTAKKGELLWTYETGNETWASPVVTDGKVYMNTKRSFAILNAGKDKNVLFERKGGSESALIAANKTLYHFERGKLYAIAKGIAPEAE